MTIKNFTDLEAWQKSRILTLEVYKATKEFPTDERFALVNQMRRASISIISNVAEGFGRNTAKDKSQFYAMAKGSLLELQSQLIISYDLNYIDKSQLENFQSQILTATRLISGLINSAKDRPS